MIALGHGHGRRGVHALLLAHQVHVVRRLATFRDVSKQSRLLLKARLRVRQCSGTTPHCVQRLRLDVSARPRVNSERNGHER